MNRKDSIAQMGQILRARREKLLQTLDGNTQSLYRIYDGVSGDMADAAATTIQDHLNSKLAEVESGGLDKIDAALRRIREGRYGVCQRCEGNIPLARLNALPYAIFCVSCQQALESQSGGSVSDPDWDRVADSLDGEDLPDAVGVEQA